MTSVGTLGVKFWVFSARNPSPLRLIVFAWPLLAYALFGPSRILVLGPDSSLAPIIAASILPLAGGDPDRSDQAKEAERTQIRNLRRGV